MRSFHCQTCFISYNSVVIHRIVIGPPTQKSHLALPHLKHPVILHHLHIKSNVLKVNILFKNVSVISYHIQAPSKFHLKYKSLAFISNNSQTLSQAT